MFSFPKLSIRTPQSLTHTIRMHGDEGQQRSTHVWKRGLAPLIELMPMIYFYDLRLASATVCSSSSLLRAQQDTSFVHGKLGSSVGDGSTLSASVVERESCPDTLHGGLVSAFLQTLLLLRLILFAFTLLGFFENEAKPSGGGRFSPSLLECQTKLLEFLFLSYLAVVASVPQLTKA